MWPPPPPPQPVRYTITATDAEGATTTTKVSVTVIADLCSGTTGWRPATVDADLIKDCDILLSARDQLEGTNNTDALNWGTGTSMSSWTGIRPDNFGRYVFVIGLENMSLNGSIPGQLGGISHKLSELYLHDNALTGGIPPELGDLSGVDILELYNNQLTGEIPAELGIMVTLHDIDLSNNRLTGEIPAALGGSGNSFLRELRLHNNRLTGSIPAQLVNLNNLTHLLLHNNQLSGRIPAEFNNANRFQNLNNLSLYGNRLETPVELTVTPATRQLSENASLTQFTV